MNCLKEFETNLAYHFSEILEYPFAKPYWIYISLSHKCTFKCQMCGVVKILQGYELPNHIVKKAIEDIAKWQWDCVLMFTGGEPFLRKDIFELINYSVKKNLKTEIVTNGYLIDEELAYKIIPSGLQHIAISLDGAKETTHDFIREKGSFERAINAIENLVEAKRRSGIGAQISVWTTIMKENVRELFDIISLCKNLGVDCLVYHPVIIAQDDMQNTSFDAPFWIRGNDLELLKEQINKIIGYQTKYGLVAFLHDPNLWIKYFEGTLPKEDWKCNPFVFINIGPDGEARSCGSSFGNIKEMGLNECLNTDEAYNVRKLMKLCQRPCLQTCWARPEADSLLKIIDDFILGIRNSKNKDKLLREALEILDKYRNRLME